MLVHAAEFEPYGVVVLEAAFMGLPLIVSDVTGAIGRTAIARPGENTLVFPCSDVAGLAAAIGELIASSGRREGMAARSLEIARDHEGGKTVEGFVSAVAFTLADRKGERDGR